MKRRFDSFTPTDFHRIRFPGCISMLTGLFKTSKHFHMEQTTTQAKLILNHLQRRPITPIDALSLYGCFRLGARIFDLRQDGHDIHTRSYYTPNGKRVAQYFIPKQSQP